MTSAADRARPGHGLDVEALGDDSSFALLKDEWEELEGRAAEDNIFLTYVWQHAWWQDLGTGDLDLVTFRDEGRLVGLAPTYHEKVGGFPAVRFGGGLEVSDYLGILVQPGYEVSVGRAFLERCLELPGLVIDFHFLRSDGATVRMLTAAARDMDRRYHIENEEVSPYIEIRGDWESYLAGLSKKDRHELRRKRRRLEEAGGWAVVESQPATLADDLESFFDLHAKSSRAKEDFLTDDIKTFFRHISFHLQEAGWLSLRSLRFKDQPVAAVLGFLYRGRLLLYNPGYDPPQHPPTPGFASTSRHILLPLAA